MSKTALTLEELLDELLATGNFPGRAAWIESVRTAIAEQPRPVASNPLGRLHLALASAERIDVLGVLSDCASELPSHESELEMMAARDAVTDLMSASQELCRSSGPSYPAEVDLMSILDQAIERERQAGQAFIPQLVARHVIAELVATTAELVNKGRQLRNTVVETRGVRGMDEHDLALRQAQEVLSRVGVSA